MHNLSLGALLLGATVWAQSRSESAPIPSATGASDSDGSSDGKLPTDGSLVLGYYPNWVMQTYPMAQVPFEDLSIAVWFTHGILENGTVDRTAMGDVDAKGGLAEFVSTAKSKNKNVSGGWNGSRYLTKIAKSASLRKTLTEDVVSIYKSFGLQGIELDWEFPGGPENEGAPCNLHSPDDTKNFLTLLQELRKSLGDDAIMETCTGGGSAFYGKTKEVSSDIAAFGDVLDLVLIMDYDIGNPLAIGPKSKYSNSMAPMRSEGCAPEEKYEWGQYSLEDAFNSWTGAGFPKSKLITGIAAYGRNWQLTKAPTEPSLYWAHDNFTVGDEISQSDGEKVATDNCPGSTKVDIGIYFYPSIVSEVIGTSGWGRYFDECTATPFLINEEKKQLLSYDDAQSICYKKQFTKEHGMAGVGFFDVRGLDDQGAFLDALTGGSSDCAKVDVAGKTITKGTVSMSGSDANATQSGEEDEAGPSGSGASSGGPSPTDGDGSTEASDTESNSSASESASGPANTGSSDAGLLRPELLTALGAVALVVLLF